MFLNSLPQPTSKDNSQSVNKAAQPDYALLVKFLIQPFLESKDSLSVDCEFANKSRVWVRVAFEGEDKGRVFGRGGRNIQSIRTVIAAAAALAGHSVYLDIYGSGAFNGMSSTEEVPIRSPEKPNLPRATSSRPNIKPRAN